MLEITQIRFLGEHVQLQQLKKNRGCRSIDLISSKRRLEQTEFRARTKTLKHAYFEGKHWNQRISSACKRTFNRVCKMYISLELIERNYKSITRLSVSCNLNSEIKRESTQDAATPAVHKLKTKHVVLRMMFWSSVPMYALFRCITERNDSKARNWFAMKTNNASWMFDRKKRHYDLLTQYLSREWEEAHLA